MKIPAYAHNGQFVIWCEHENGWHYHGAQEGGRASHCNCRRSPMADHYTLVLTPGLDQHPERKKLDRMVGGSAMVCRNSACKERARRETRRNRRTGLRRNKKAWDLLTLEDRSGNIALKNGVTVSRDRPYGLTRILKDGNLVKATNDRQTVLDVLYLDLDAL